MEEVTYSSVVGEIAYLFEHHLKLARPYTEALDNSIDKAWALIFQAINMETKQYQYQASTEIAIQDIVVVVTFARKKGQSRKVNAVLAQNRCWLYTKSQAISAAYDLRLTKYQGQFGGQREYWPRPTNGGKRKAEKVTPDRFMFPQANLVLWNGTLRPTKSLLSYEMNHFNLEPQPFDICSYLPGAATVLIEGESELFKDYGIPITRLVQFSHAVPRISYLGSPSWGLCYFLLMAVKDDRIYILTEDNIAVLQPRKFKIDVESLNQLGVVGGFTFYVKVLGKEINDRRLGDFNDLQQVQWQVHTRRGV